MAIITITEQADGLGYEIARKTSQRLDYVLVDGALIGSRLNSAQESDEKQFVEQVVKGQIPPYIFKKFLIEQALKNNVILLNLGGEILFHNFPGTLHVRINSSNRKLRLRSAEKKSYTRFVGKLYGRKKLSGSLYDLQIKVENMDTDFAAELIVKAAEVRGINTKAGVTWRALKRLRAGLERSRPPSHAVDEFKSSTIPSFAHPSEMDFAQVLDFYRIRWEYEPKSFPINWDEGGRVIEKFTPDFYLPDLDLYIELTTLKQSLITKKNRKVRRLKELYPDVNIKIFYRRDYKRLLQRFGIQKRNDSK